MPSSRRRNRTLERLALSVLALGLTSCALLDPPSPRERARLGEVAIGQALARAQCQACHQVQGATLYGAAPPLTEIARRYQNTRLDWELETISQVGHYRMPRKILSASEITALTAYIQSLEAVAPEEKPMRRRPTQGRPPRID